jgi:hypothetical protein
VFSHSNGLPNYFVVTFSDESRREQAEKLFVRVPDRMRTSALRLLELARVLVRVNHVARFIVKATVAPVVVRGPTTGISHFSGMTSAKIATKTIHP